MKYTLEASLRELLARSRRLRRKRERQIIRSLSAAAAVLFAGLLSVMGTVAGQLEQGEETSVFGAFILPNTAGGYVLAGVIAFALGAAFTMLCLRHSKRSSEGKAEETDGHAPDVPTTIKEEES